MTVVKRKSILDQKWYEMDIPLSEMEIINGLNKWHRGEKIQDIFYTLNAEQREFLQSGITPKVWEEKIRKPQEEADKEEEVDMSIMDDHYPEPIDWDEEMKEHRAERKE